MKVVLMHQTIVKHDAIGNDICLMYEILSKRLECYVYCDNLLSLSINRIDKNQLLDIIADNRNLLIYHHSVYWSEGEGILGKCKAKLIIRYHNITPPEFFSPYCEEYFYLCAKGREQTERLNEKFKDALWVCDSCYNTHDILSDKMAVFPPFTNIGQWSAIMPDESILKGLFESQKINLLFVGRIAPNKGHKHLFKIIKDFHDNYSSDICLYIIGKKDDGLAKYNYELDSMINLLGIEQNIKFIGEINDQLLISYYLGCDFFVCCSEHEGFCVPLLEAQYFHLPIIAMDTSAISETLGSNQVVLSKNILEYSAAIKVLSKDVAAKDFLIENGFYNYRERFHNDKLVNRFIEILREFTGEEI